MQLTYKLGRLALSLYFSLVANLFGHQADTQQRVGQRRNGYVKDVLTHDGQSIEQLFKAAGVGLLALGGLSLNLGSLLLEVLLVVRREIGLGVNLLLDLGAPFVEGRDDF